jgi:hypothetical protein
VLVLVLLVLVLVLLVLVLVLLVLVLVLLVLVLVELVETLLLLLLPTLPEPGPLTLDMPLVCSVVGNNGSISCSQTVVYIPGLPSEARLPGSRLPQFSELAQHALALPQSGPAAQAVQPMYTSLSAM